MRVPLAAHRVNPASCPDHQMLDVWTNGHLKRVPAPFLPYMYTRQRLSGGFTAEERVTLRPLSTLEAQDWWKYSFPTVQGVSQASRAERSGNGHTLDYADNHVAFVERVLVDEPEFFTRWPNTKPVRKMYLDIEQLTTGRGFPGRKQPLISIAWAVDDEEPQCVLGDGESDADILKAFMDAVKQANPDVLVGYNVDGYDLPMIVKRLEENGMDAGGLSRTGRAPPSDAEGDDFHLEGRLVYDVFDSVIKDQTLFGIKDRRLKTVAKWLKFNVIEEDTTDTRQLVGTDRLRTYNVNDVVITRQLAGIYWKNFVALAEFYGAPLNVVMRATPSFHMTMLQGRVFRNAKPLIASDGRNDERYRDLYRDAGGQAFVGGIVEIYQRGLFQPVWKVDFSSMYPSIMVSLGTGADNTRILGTSDLGPFVVKRDGERRIYSIPDESRGVNLDVEITGISPMAEELRQLLQQRIELKKKAKAAEDPDERERLHATQNVLKVVLNSVYGVHASAFARYGSLPVAVATVGIARQLIRLVEETVGDAKIETDTDGVYTAAEPDVDRLNKVCADFMQDELGGENYTRIDAETFKAGYFHQRKSYLLLHEDGRIEKHGIAFKGSSLCGVFDKTLDAVSQALLTGDQDTREVGRACFDLDAYGQDDFVMRVRLGKSLDQYAAANAVGAQVARAYEKVHGYTPKKGDQLEYVKTKNGYEPPTPDAFRRLDHEYYKGLVENVLERLDIDWRPHQQASLSDWF